jgi:hypothetical protein
VRSESYVIGGDREGDGDKHCEQHWFLRIVTSKREKN